MFVKIVKVPIGEADYPVRKAWVGLILPCTPLGHTIHRGVVTGTSTTEHGGYSVPAPIAIDILGMFNPEAARWWTENTPCYSPCCNLVFNSEACEVIN